MNALLALRPCKAFGRSFQASLPCLPLPLHLILPSPTTIAKGQQPLSPHNLPKSHYPLLCTITLASLVKGRWIDGKAQTVALLHFYLRYIHLFDLSNFSPSRRRDCLTTIPRLHQPFQNRTIPCFAPPHLPPLSKVRCCRPKKFGRLPEGLPHHHPSLAPTLPKPHYPPRFS